MTPERREDLRLYAIYSRLTTVEVAEVFDTLALCQASLASYAESLRVCHTKPDGTWDGEGVRLEYEQIMALLK